MTDCELPRAKKALEDRFNSIDGQLYRLNELSQIRKDLDAVMDKLNSIESELGLLNYINSKLTTLRGDLHELTLGQTFILVVVFLGIEIVLRIVWRIFL